MEMESNANLPEPLVQIQRHLKPYIKARQDVGHIRRVLAVHISHVTSERNPGTRPLSLIEGTRDVDSLSSGIRGIRKEYLRCVRANVETRREYATIIKEYQIHSGNQHSTEERYAAHDPLGSFMDLVKQNRKYERLRIVQDYLNTLAQKPASTTDHLDSKDILKDIRSLPKVPQEVMSATSRDQGVQKVDLKALVAQLEKAVLRAKFLLKKEQNLLASFRARKPLKDDSVISDRGRLQALSITRNELINWIETELGKAGENAHVPNEEQTASIPDKRGKDHVDGHLESIKIQYECYVRAREAFISSMSRDSNPPAPITVDEETLDASIELSDISNDINHIIHPYLEELASVSNQQKSMIQQKSHLTVSLAKKIKEIGQGLERLADESHLLPKYPIPGISRRKALESSICFGDEISNYEKPDSSRRARAWVFAANSANDATKQDILEKLEEGEVALADARRTLLEVQYLLGTGNGGESDKSDDIWATLDGHLGVIRGDDDYGM
ncbi:hypothetical protein B7494_g5138 [Chlorociboria aeruginascens]|nr:hypothetical protein B7494_g5138 [Chlorociboria aeruginascens]